MATETGLEEVALKVAQGMHDFAESRGWSPNDYRVFMVVNSPFWRLRITLFSKAFRDRSADQEITDYDDVSDAIEKRLGKDINFFNYMGLILTDDEAHARERGTPRSANEFEIDEALINPVRGRRGRPRQGAR
jgi:hypothetical protein